MGVVVGVVRWGCGVGLVYGSSGVVIVVGVVGWG